MADRHKKEHKNQKGLGHKKHTEETSKGIREETSEDTQTDDTNNVGGIDMTKEVDDEMMAAAKALSAAADSFAGVGHARTTSNFEGRTTKDADRSETSTASFSRRDSDIGIEEAWSQFAIEAARRDRVHFDNEQTDSRRHANESSERTAMLHTESIKHMSSLAAQVLDAQKLGTNNMWTASNELEQVVLGIVTKVLAENAGKTK